MTTVLCLLLRRILLGFFVSSGTRFLFAAASPSSKSVKGSHGGVLVAHRCSLQQGAMVANVDYKKVEWRGHDWVTCVVKSREGLLRVRHGVHDANGLCQLPRKYVQTPADLKSVVETEA